MSRSYRKYLSDEDFGYSNPGWNRLRLMERACLNRVLRDKDDDVLFPQFVRSPNRGRRYCSVCEIRDEYFTDIRNILNGYHTNSRYAITDSQEEFLHCFNVIKGTVPDDGRVLRFEWLNNAPAKKLVKLWDGEPLDVLGELTRRRIIQNAIRLERDRRKRK